MSKFERKNVQQAKQNEQDGDDTNCSGHKPQSIVEYCQTPPPIWAGKTMDLTLLAVTRALDTLVVNKYRSYYLSCPDTASIILTVFSRYADTIVFALSSSTVVRLQFGAIPFSHFTQLKLQE